MPMACCRSMMRTLDKASARQAEKQAQQDIGHGIYGWTVAAIVRRHPLAVIEKLKGWGVLRSAVHVQ